MTNTFNKITQSVYEAFKGPRTKDYEFEKMAQEYQISKDRMLSMKSIIDNYPEKLEGYKFTIETLISHFESIFSKDQEQYFQFMTNVTGAHKALVDKLLKMFTKIGQLQTSMNKWTEHCTSVDGKLEVREEKRKTFDHYDEKMAEMLEERNKILMKGKVPSEKDDEKYFRNIKKYQNAANEYVDATNEAYKHICYFLDSRYENISLSVVEFIEIEAAFYNEASYIFNFFRNSRNQISFLKQNFRPTKRDYEASNFIRGKSLLNIDADELMKQCQTFSGVIEGKKDYNRTSTTKDDMKNNQNFNQNNNTNNNNFSQQRSNTLNPYGNNNYNNNYNNNRNYAPNHYTNKFDNTIPDPFSNNNNNNGFGNPYGNNGNNGNNMDNNMAPSHYNPYSKGNNNLGDNPFDHPNV